MTVRSRIFAAIYDRQMAKVEKAWLGARRVQVLAGVHGDVLEIGAGTGANLAHYGPVDSLTLTEPEAPMLRRLQRRVAQLAPTAMVLRAPAEDLPFDPGSFDVVVSTLVLCGVDDQPRTLREIRRVLRPGGQLVFVEHVRADDTRLARKQDRMTGVNRFLIGCDCNRPTLTSIEAAGYALDWVERTTVPNVPSFVSPWICGVARSASTSTASTSPASRAVDAP